MKNIKSFDLCIYLMKLRNLFKQIIHDLSSKKNVLFISIFLFSGDCSWQTTQEVCLSHFPFKTLSNRTMKLKLLSVLTYFPIYSIRQDEMRFRALLKINTIFVAKEKHLFSQFSGFLQFFFTQNNRLILYTLHLYVELVILDSL